MIVFVDSDGKAMYALVDSDKHLQADVLTMPTVTVTATNLDIRDLASASDSVSCVQSGSWTVTATATNLDIRGLTSASDSVAAVQSGTWDIGTVATLTGITNDVSIDDGGNSITVDGTVSVTDATPSTLNCGQVDHDSNAQIIITGSGSNRSVLIKNIGSKNVYIGPAAVSTSNGYQLKPDAAVAMDTEATIYGVCGAGETTTTCYLQLS